MFAQQNVDACTIPFLDCRGYYDLASEIVGLVLAGLLVYRSLVNYRQLKQETNQQDDTEYQQSLLRKIRINLINILFLGVLIGNFIFSMVLFQIASEQTLGDITQNQLQKWYKSTQILFVELLNLLLLAVGLVYWHGLYFFFKVQEIKPPLAFSKIAKYVMRIFGAYCIVTFAVGTVIVFENNNNDFFLLNLLVLLSSSFSIIAFTFFRLAYYKHIFRSVKLGSKVINRQRIFNTLVILSSLTRVALCLLQMNGISLNQLRKYSSDCYDILPFHSIVLLFITICVNLLPSFVFSRIFTTLQRQRHRHKTEIDQTLFSIQPSQFVSNLVQQ